jgi:hypothetical protein
MRAAIIITLLLLSGSAAIAEEEEWQTITCITTDTLMTCVSRQPCNTYVRSPKGELTFRKAKINWPDGTPAGDFNQAEFERTVETRCGKIK